MKYIIGSLIISFGVLLVLVVIMGAMNVQAPEGGMKYFGIAWLVIAVLCYPFSKKIIRD